MDTTTNSNLRTAGRTTEPRTEEREAVEERTAAAFGLAAAIAIIFNTLLAWVKDAYAPLNHFMALLTGHHWRTHGIVVVAVFFLLGWYFTSRKGTPQMTDNLIITVAAAVVAGGIGLVGWFFFV